MIVPPPGIYSAWGAWRAHGILPRAGGYYDQSLPVLVQFAALDAVQSIFDTLKSKSETEGGQANLSQTQLVLQGWLNG